MAILLLAACSSSHDGSEIKGGAGASGSAGTHASSSASGGSGLGGTTAAGGNTSVAGGSAVGGSSTATSSSAGGIVATGGAGGASSGGDSTSVGGAFATGGSTDSGGTSSTGGRSGMGGNPGTGGGSAGGASGGATRSGGTTGAGGLATGGRTGMGGTAGSGGSATGGRVGTGGVGGGAGTGGVGGSTGGMATGGATGFDPCPASGPCKIMPLGDSITDGTGYAGGYRVELFAKSLADKKNITFVGSLSNGPSTVSGVTFPKSHEGHFGWTISQVDGLIPDPALGPAPHIVLLHLGTNDINQNLTSGAPDRLGSLIDQIISKLPDSLVVVAKIIPEPSKASAIDTFNAAVPGVVQTRASAGKHVILVDQFKGFPSSELGDGVHPNQAGYERMAGVWYEAIKSYLH